MGNEQCNTCNVEGKENLRTVAAGSMEESKAKKTVEESKVQLNNTKQYQSKTNQQISFPSGIVYKGEWLGVVKHGYGVQVWPDGAKYEGEWSEGKANGRGKFTHADGDAYEGEWKQDKANGEGVYIHSNGARYEGYWKDDLQCGRGK